MLIWITGLPGAGKTTFAEVLVKQIRSVTTIPVVHLDGDSLRSILPSNPGYGIDNRLKISRFYASLALKLEKDGVVVVCSFVSLFHEIHASLRSLSLSYYEIFIDPSYHDLKQQNKKGLYGCDKNSILSQIESFEFPEKPDMTIRDPLSLKKQSKAVTIILNKFFKKDHNNRE